MSETEQKSPAPVKEPAWSMDPDVNPNIPAPYLIGTIFKDGMATPVQIIGTVKDNATGHVALFVPTLSAKVASCSLTFRRPEDGIPVGEWMLAAMNQAGQKLYDDFEENAKQEALKRKLAKPDKRLVAPKPELTVVGS